jgi:phasin family protein
LKYNEYIEYIGYIFIFLLHRTKKPYTIEPYGHSNIFGFIIIVLQSEVTMNKNMPNPFEMFQEMMGKMPMMPNMDMKGMNEMGQRCNKAMNNTSDNAQAVMRRQAQMMQDSAKNMSEMVKRCASGANMENISEAQMMFAKETMKEQMSNTKELSDMMMKSGMEALDACRQFMTEGMQDCMHMMQPQKKKATA